MSTHIVQLYIYDLSRGMAAAISPMLLGKFLNKIKKRLTYFPIFFSILGKRIDGVWHTSIVVYSREYFFGSRGVESCNPVSMC